MKFGDRMLQRWRIGKARRWIRPGARLLDIGCADGAIFRQLGDAIAEGIGIDPEVCDSYQVGRGRMIRGYFPENLPDQRRFDAITMLAVLEHIPQTAQAKLAADCVRYLNPGGTLIITVPSPLVDRILAILKALRLVDGMSLDEHYGFRPQQTPIVFEPAGFKRIRHQRFQLGLNHLFVFQKSHPVGDERLIPQPATAGAASAELALPNPSSVDALQNGFDVTT